MSQDKLIGEQIEYYRRRAAEYDEWFLRQGRYDRGEAHTAVWQVEVAQVQTALTDFNPQGAVLELACGTGWWTEQLNRFAESITAVDSSLETIAINKQRVNSDKVTYVEADIFTWQPTQTYDVVFFSFWLSHVPPNRFKSFWQTVKQSLKADGRVFLIDSLHAPDITAKDQRLNAEDETTAIRRLNDGSTFEIVKVFYTPERLDALLTPLGWKTHLKTTSHSMLYGSAILSPKNNL